MPKTKKRVPFHENMSLAMHSAGYVAGQRLNRAIHAQTDRDAVIATRTMLHFLAISHVPPPETTHFAEVFSNLAFMYQKDEETVKLCIKAIAALRIQQPVLDYIQPIIDSRADSKKQMKLLGKLLQDVYKKRGMLYEENPLPIITGDFDRSNPFNSLFLHLDGLRTGPAELEFLRQFKTMVEKTIRQPKKKDVGK